MIALVPEGKNYKALPDEYRGLYKYHEALTRYHSKKPSLTINTCHRSHFHYKYLRIPTVRESARLQARKMAKNITKTKKKKSYIPRHKRKGQ